MELELLTKADLQQFKKELLEEIRQTFKSDQLQSKKWLKSAEVRKILNISPGTLQHLRINGTLPFQKLGGILYYAESDIFRLLGNRKETNASS